MCGREMSSFPHVSDMQYHGCLFFLVPGSSFFVILRWLSSLSSSSHTGEGFPDSWPVVCETNTFPLIAVAHRHIPSTLVASEIARGPLRGC